MDRHNILLIASESGDGQFRTLIDPELKAELEARGIFCTEAFLRDVQTDDFDLFDAVVMMRSPVAGHAKDDSDIFKRHIEGLDAYVKSGGGLILMFAESYGKSVASLNRLAGRFDLSFEFNIIEESNPARLSSLPNMPEGKLITVDVAEDCPFASGALEIITEGGHGTQHLSCRPGRDWHPVLIGSETCISRPFPDGFYANSGREIMVRPVLAARREYGKGQVIAFPGASPFWLANAGLKRWKKRLMKQNGNRGFDFLRNMLCWVCGMEKNPGAGEEIAARFPGHRMRAEDFSFKYLSQDQRRKLDEMVPFKTYIGFMPDTGSMEDFCGRLKCDGYSAAVLIRPYASFTKSGWRDFSTECRKMREKTGVFVRPGFEQEDDEGNYCVVFNVDELPDMRSKYPNSNMLEDLLVKLNAYSAVYARGAENRIPAWRHGGYNLLEIQDGTDIELYRDRIGSCAFLSAVKICRTPDRAERVTNHLMARNLEEVFDAVCENRHFNYISDSPVLRRFFWNSECVIDDDWEGFWLEWEEGDCAGVDIEIQSEAALSEVILYDGKEILQCWHPGTGEFKTSYRITLRKDMRLHLTARDNQGGTLEASWPLYTRNRHFWAHMGSDQMNDYHNVWFMDKHGSLGIGKELYETCGFVTLGYAWGDYLRISPPVKWHDIMPQGVEVSSLAGNFQSFHPSPFVVTRDGDYDFLNNHRRTLGECDSSRHCVTDEARGSWLDRPGASWRSRSGRIITPSRDIRDSGLWQMYGRYIITSWQAGKSCTVHVEQTIVWLKDFSFISGRGFSLGHSLHNLIEGSRIVAGSEVIPYSSLEDSCPVTDDPFRKEWDNLEMISRLAGEWTRDNLYEIRKGERVAVENDPMGNYYFEVDELSGSLFLRAWKRRKGFAMSYELLPEKRDFRAGEQMRIAYRLIVDAGDFCINKD